MLVKIAACVVWFGSSVRNKDGQGTRAALDSAIV